MGMYFRKAHASDFVEIITYFNVLNTNMTLTIDANDVFKVERTKNPVFQQFFEIILNKLKKKFFVWTTYTAPKYL